MLALNKTTHNKLFLYIHIPFCLQKCSYCDFATITSSSSSFHKKYIEWLKSELLIRGTSLKHRVIETIYLGGGTPSLLSSDLLKDLLSSIKNHFKISNNIEITIEMNPGTINSKKLKIYLDHGINRLSLGVQTFSDSLLQLCGRKHHSIDSKRDLLQLSKQNINFSCDLLFALPNQTLSHVITDLKQMLTYSPPHISTYCLTIPSKHPLEQNRPKDAVQIEMFKKIEEILTSKGYVQYEMSSFALPSFESKHNQAYWNDEEFWGLGLGAHSYLKTTNYGVRFWNSRNIKIYEKQIFPDHFHSSSTKKQNNPLPPYSFLPSSQVEFLTKKESLSDFCHTALRTHQGLEKEKLMKKFGSHSYFEIHKKLGNYVKQGLIQETLSHWSLNFQGRILSNQIFSTLI